MKNPPALATWLFKRLGPADDALAGDLLEEYQSRDSPGWFWRQVLFAILTTHDRVLVARAVVVGWVTLWAFGQLTDAINHEFRERTLDWLIVNLGSHPFVMLWAVVLANQPFRCVAYVLSGWLVARLHPTCRTMAVFVFMVTVLVRSGMMTARWFITQNQVYDHVAFPAWNVVFAALPLVILLAGSRGRKSVRRSIA